MADYEKINWKNGEEGGTPTSAANFGHMEDGIDAATKAATAAQRTADSALTSDSELDMTKIGETTAHSRDVMRSDSAAKTRQIIGAGTSSLTIGTTGSTAAAGDHKHSYNDLTDKPTIPSTDGLASQSALEALESRIAALESADGE
ncbi:MAG: hypothetical protein ACI38U_03150 [Corynebacterium sp.]|uniref:hypothetical protein n=1 Tax=Corynebacterium sp. TaxID=1720 RepID=UPI003F02DE82